MRQPSVVTISVSSFLANLRDIERWQNRLTQIINRRGIFFNAGLSRIQYERSQRSSCGTPRGLKALRILLSELPPWWKSRQTKSQSAKPGRLGGYERSVHCESRSLLPPANLPKLKTILRQSRLFGTVGQHARSTRSNCGILSRSMPLR